MSKATKTFKAFIMERYAEGYKKLSQDPEFNRLRDQYTDALHDLLGDSPELKDKYSVFENIEGLLEAEYICKAYLQGIKDADDLKGLIG